MQQRLISPILLVLMISAMLITPLYAQLTPARDLTGNWNSGVSGKYYDMDPSDSTTRMNDITATFTMVITQQGSQISIVLNMYPTSWTTDSAYLQAYGMSGVPPVGFGNIYFVGTVSGASFSADEQGASSSNQEHLAGTFTTDIITATLTGPHETSDTNGIIVIRSGSSATVPPIATPAPTPAAVPAIASTKPTAAKKAQTSKRATQHSQPNAPSSHAGPSTNTHAPARMPVRNRPRPHAPDPALPRPHQRRHPRTSAWPSHHTLTPRWSAFHTS